MLKLEKKIKVLFICIFFGTISFIGFCTLFNTASWNSNEIRTLQQFPEFDVRRLKDSTYYSSITNAFSDQLEYRDRLVELYFKLQYNVAKQGYLGDTVIGKEEFLFTKPELITDQEAHQKELLNCIALVNKQANEMNSFGTKLIYINYPRKDVVLTKYLPWYYKNPIQQYEQDIELIRSKLNKNIIFIDAYEVLDKNRTPRFDFFYQTDHHVNLRGGQLIYEELMKSIQKDYPDVTIFSLQDYTIQKSWINGSYNRKIGQIIETGLEELQITPKTFEYDYTRYESGKVSDIKLCENKEAYSSYMGGDNAETIINNNKMIKEPLSVIFTGSSFTNVLEVLSVPSFKRMISVDFRANKTDKTIIDYVSEYKPDYVVYIPNQSDHNFHYDSFKLHMGLNK